VFLFRLEIHRKMKEGAERPGRAASTPWILAKKASPRSLNRPGCICSTDATGIGGCTSGRRAAAESAWRSYFLESRWVDAKDGFAGAGGLRTWKRFWWKTEREALALENNLISSTSRSSTSCCAGRQDVPVHQADAFTRNIPGFISRGRVKKDGSLYFGRRIFRPASRGGFYTSFTKRFLGAFVLCGPDEEPSAAMPAVLHSSLPGAVRGGIGRPMPGTRRRCAMRGCFWRAGGRT